jgi:hypothetical protein
VPSPLTEGRRPISTEFELKLAAPVAKLEKLKRVLLAMPTVKSEVRPKLVSTYYDTPDSRWCWSHSLRATGWQHRLITQYRSCHRGGYRGNHFEFERKASDYPMTLKIPTPAELHPRLSELETKRNALHVERTGKVAEAATIRARIQTTPSNGNVAENRVRVILGETPLPDAAPTCPD